MINLSSAPVGDTHGSNLQFVDASAPRLHAPGGGGDSSFDTETPKPQATDDEASQGVLGGITPAFLKTARHPLVCVFHLLFKILALLSFIFGSFIFGGWNGDFVFTFVSTTIFLSVDFWTVKNVTGRVLVGMRWWNNINDDGSSSWVFESSTDERFINTTDKTIFWTTLYLWATTWVVFLILYVIRLQVEWVLLVVVGLTLAISNLVGFWKCSKDAKNRMKEWASTQAVRSIFGRFGGS